MEHTNAEKLAAVVSCWARPAITEIASAKVAELPFMKSLQATVMGSGLVGPSYSLAMDVQPLVTPVVNAIITPMVEHAVANLPDHSIPQVAHSVVQQLKRQGSMSVLDGLVTFDMADFEKLDELLHKNLPVEESSAYQVIT